MRRDSKIPIIVLVSFITFERIIGVEDEDDLAWSKINKLLIRSPRMIGIDNKTSSVDLDDEKELESKLSNLLEFHRRDSPYVSFEPKEARDEEEGNEKSTTSEITESVKPKTTTAKTNQKNKHVQAIEKIGRKLTDKDTKITVSLPVAVIFVGSVILVTCCCSLYLRNRLAACFDKITGKKKKKTRKMLMVDPERGKSKPKSRKKISQSKKSRARSLSLDVTNFPTQKSSAITMTHDNDEPSTTGCYRCCKKKKKSRK